MTVAVTGATGHLGANVVRALLASGRSVRAITAEPLNQQVRSLDWLNVERVHADARDEASVARAVAGCDVVYNIVARTSINDWDTSDVWSTDLHGTTNLVDACLQSKVRRLVHVSSYHAISSTEGADPSASPYARSKAFSERIVLRAVAEGLDAVIVNPTAMIGPWDFIPSMLGRFLIDVWRGRLPAVVSGGADCVDVRDVANALLAAEQRGATGARYIVAGRWFDMAELATIACSVTGSRAPAFSTSRPVTERWPARVQFAAAEETLAHCPRRVEESIADTHAWFADHGMIKGAEPTWESRLLSSRPAPHAS